MLTSPLATDAAVGVARTAAKVAWATLIKHPSALPDEEIAALAVRAERAGGITEIGGELGTRRLPAEVLEDAYMRIIVFQQRIGRTEAEDLMSSLRGVSGLGPTLRKTAGASGAKTAGHLNEIRIAGAGRANRFTVRGIGVSFNDGLKRGSTDIDVLMAFRGRTLAVEAKDYRSDTLIPLDAFRADMDSLVQYRKLNPAERVIPVFTITNKPNDAATTRLLEQAARQRGVELLYGNPEQQIYQLRVLVDVYERMQR